MHPEHAQARLRPQREGDDRGALGLLEGPPQQHVGLRGAADGLEEVRGAQQDRIHLVRGHELHHVDLVVLLRREGVELLIREHDGLVTVLVGLVDVLVVDLPPAHLAAPLVADPPVVVVVHLVEGDVVRTCRPVELHRHVHESEGDLTAPYRAHAP